jgi:site-specific recombinase XerD
MAELIDDAINYAFANGDATAARDLQLKLERIRADFGNKDVAQVTRQDIAAWLDAEAVARKWKPSSRNRYHSAWSLLFRLGIENGKVDTNTAKGIQKKQEDNGRVRFLSKEEDLKLGNAVWAMGEDALVAVLTLSLHTGMRLSEQERCLVGDYDATTGMFMVRQKKNRRGPTVRYVPMTPLAREAYEKLCEGKKPGDPLCAEQMKTVGYWFPQCVEKAGMTDYTWHCNRHTFCSRMVMAGVPIGAVAQMAGHRNIQMTMRYSHLMPRANEQAVAGMMSYYA